jgi:hypothetical protein
MITVAIINTTVIIITTAIIITPQPRQRHMILVVQKHVHVTLSWLWLAHRVPNALFKTLLRL